MRRTNGAGSGGRDECADRPQDIRTFIDQLPKAELHVHIEGTLEPEMMLEFAERNEVRIPFQSVEQVREAYDFEDLAAFLDLYYNGTRVLREERDFYELTWAYLKKAASQNVRHAEIFFDPQAHTERGVPFDSLINGIYAALRAAEQELQLTSSLILCFLRHLSAESAEKTLHDALRFRDWIVGVGLDSDERGHPPQKFAKVFERALAADLRTVAHAGEEGPPAYIRGALDHLKVSRIDHGVRCLEDEELVARLVTESIPLTICPLSNVKLRVFDSMQQHNLGKLLERGVRVTINSDDPAYFGGYIAENYLAVHEGLSIDREQLARVAKHSFEAAFLDAGRKKTLVSEVERFTDRNAR